MERGQAEVIGLILDGLPDVVRSVRVLIVGASQRGKTTFARMLCAALASRGHGGSLVVFDQKFPDRAQYEGLEVTTLEGLYASLADHEPVIVCRAPLTAEDGAAAVRAAAETGDAATLLGDEIQPMLRVNRDTGEPVERVWAGSSLVWLCLQGGGLGGSFVQLCQLPRMVPGSLVDNVTATVFFGSGGRSLDYALDLKLLPREAAPVVARLAVGQCCVFFPDRQWDGETYGPG
jgi:L-fucose mutarotase/ribose pyranase (RbsD/FucU family)